MRISLIGMTGTGKSYWSKRLAKEGFKRIACDDLIAEKLTPEINQYNDSIKSLGEWMGRPYEVRYPERSAYYLELEKAVLLETIASLENARDIADKNVVIDTTGSFIYTGQDTILNLKKHSTFVHLATPPEIQKQVMAYYLAKPGPVLWLDKFTMQPGETYQEAVARCYPLLLESREKAYQEYADLSIDYYQRRREGFLVEDFIRMIHDEALKKDSI